MAGLRLDERAEDLLQLSGRDPDSRVLHPDVGPGSSVQQLGFRIRLRRHPAGYPDGPSRLGELDRVGEQVHHDLSDPVLVAPVDGPRPVRAGIRDLDVVLRGLRSDQRERRHGVHEGLQPGPALPDGLFRELPLGNVSDEAGEDVLAAFRVLAEGDLDRNLVSVSPEGGELHSLPRDVPISRTQVVLHPRAVRRPQAFRNQDLQRPTDQLLGAIAEDALHGGIGREDGAGVVYDKDAVGVDLGQRPIARLAHPKCLLDSLPIGDVRVDGDRPDHLSAHADGGGGRSEDPVLPGAEVAHDHFALGGLAAQGA
jgi:hypothetical protein